MPGLSIPVMCTSKFVSLSVSMTIFVSAYMYMSCPCARQSIRLCCHTVEVSMLGGRILIRGFFLGGGGWGIMPLLWMCSS
jgi:hypothetical protein